jgi:putative spermidine/putrescine transport system permease protein
MSRATGSLHLARRLFAVVFCGLMLLPLMIVLVASFTSEGYVKFPPSSFGLRWYKEVLANADFTGGLIFSLEIATIVALLSGTLGVLAAIALSRRKFPGRSSVTGLLTMPLTLPHIVLAIALLQFFSTLAIPSSPYGLLAGHLLITIPYVLRLAMTSLRDLDPQIERASYSLGASTWQTLRLVILPMIAPAVLAGVVFAFLLSFDEVTISLFTALPGHTTLPAQIFEFASQGSDPVITAVSGLMILLASALVLVVEHFFGVLRLIANEQK